MPTYQYACTACAERLEVVQRFTDDPLTDCPSCAGTLRKVFSPVGVVFKGSGFYKTDSRGSSSSTSSSAAAGGSGGTSETSPGTPAPAAPAPAPAPAASEPGSSSSTAAPKAATA